jgi:diguanylate cyclase (GGDEF)-like protein
MMRWRLVILLAIMVLPFVGFSAFRAYDISRSRLTEQRQANLARARSVAYSIDGYVESTEEILNTIAHSDAVLEGDPEALSAWFADILAQCGHYGNIVYFDTSGDLIASGRSPEAGQRINVSSASWFKRSMVSTELAVGEFSLSKIGGLPDVHLSLPVFDREGRRVGVVSAALNLTRVQDRLMREKAPPYMTIAVVDHDGVVIARNRDPEQWVGTKVLSGFQIRQMILRHEGTGEAMSPDGKRMTGTYTEASEAPWFVRVGVGTGYIRSLVLRDIGAHFAVFVPLMLVAIAGWLWIGRDVDRMHRRSERLSLVDSLTGLGNSRSLHDDLEYSVQHALRTEESLAFAMMDLDDFKAFNDRFGHIEGDRALQSAALAIQGAIRAADRAYRYGGEEFCVLFPDADAEGAAAVAERIREAVAGLELRPHSADEPVGLSISIGIAVFPEDSRMADELMSCADSALYRAKREGKNRVAVHCDAGDTHA